MTTLLLAHKEGTARMTRALARSTRERTTHMTIATNPYVRVAGHAGVWEFDGPAIVLTDDDSFEHPTLVVVHQVADPGRFATVDIGDLTPFTPADSSAPPIAV